MAASIRIERDPLTSELEDKAKKELRETPEVVNESLDELRKLLKNDTSLFYRDDDDVLLPYLRPVKFYPQSALELMRRCAEFKDKNKSILKDLMPETLEDIIKSEDVVNVLANRDQDGRRVLIHKAGKVWDPKKVTSDQVFQMFYLVHLGAALEPATQVNGVVVILDFDGLGMSQIAALSPSFSLRLLTFIQEAMPLRLKEVHIVNQPFIFKVVWAIFKPLIKAKLNKRLFFHGSNMKELHKHISPDYLPQNYGGGLPKMDYSSKDWYPHLRNIDDFIKEHNSWGLVEKA